jgi:hypothetical protein
MMEQKRVLDPPVDLLAEEDPKLLLGREEHPRRHQEEVLQKALLVVRDLLLRHHLLVEDPHQGVDLLVLDLLVDLVDLQLAPDQLLEAPLVLDLLEDPVDLQEVADLALLPYCPVDLLLEVVDLPPEVAAPLVVLHQAQRKLRQKEALQPFQNAKRYIIMMQFKMMNCLSKKET